MQPRTRRLLTLLAGAAAWGLLAVLEKSTARGCRIWTIIASVVLALSLLGRFSAANQAATLVLMCMHLTIGAAMIARLVRR